MARFMCMVCGWGISMTNGVWHCTNIRCKYNWRDGKPHPDPR